MMAGTSPAVAIVGGGPSGCYTAQGVCREMPDASIVVFERLPVPYGLIRYGVAPDHQGTKAVTRQFERMFVSGDIRFAGGIEVGRDVSVNQLRMAFDVVILATGRTVDRSLGVPGEQLRGVYGSGLFTRALNGHPCEDIDNICVGGRVAVIGAGNVAIDVVRVLAKPPACFDGSDLDDELVRRIVALPVRSIDVVSRSPACKAKWDREILRELSELPSVALRVDNESIDEGNSPPGRAASTMLMLMRSSPSSPGGLPIVPVTFHFNWGPTRFCAVEDGVARVEFSDSHGGLQSLPADAVITAIGFESGAVEVDLSSSPCERLADIYTTGWLRTGPRGTIPTHRAEARRLAQRVRADLQSPAGPLGAGGYHVLPAHVREAAVDFAAWQRIDRLERARAAPNRCRRKVRDLSEMMRICQPRV